LKKNASSPANLASGKKYTLNAKDKSNKIRAMKVALSLKNPVVWRLLESKLK